MTAAGSRGDHATEEPTANKGPLTGFRVVELASVIMAPYATQLLGDLGADVIKVEHGKVDSSRVMGGGPHRQLSGIALNLHRNKRSISLDIKEQQGREIFLRILGASGILITNLRPGPLERLRLSYEKIAPLRPGLIYCQAQGFSSNQPEADRPAYDDIIQALTGLPGLNEEVLGANAFFPSLIADKIAGLMIAYAVLGAVVHRERTGAGQRVEVPMFDAVLSFNLVEHLGRAVTAGQPAGYSRIMTANRGPHRTLDGYIALMPYTDTHWRTLFGAVGRQDILERPWFQSHRVRLEQADLVYGDLAVIVAERTTGEWLELCELHGIPASVAPSLDEIVSDPTLHRGVLSDQEHPVVGSYRSISPPVTYSATPTSVRLQAPLVGQQTDEILSELGYSESKIEALAESGVVTRDASST